MVLATSLQVLTLAQQTQLVASFWNASEARLLPLSELEATLNEFARAPEEQRQQALILRGKTSVLIRTAGLVTKHQVDDLMITGGSKSSGLFFEALLSEHWGDCDQWLLKGGTVQVRSTSNGSIDLAIDGVNGEILVELWRELDQLPVLLEQISSEFHQSYTLWSLLCADLLALGGYEVGAYTEFYAREVQSNANVVFSKSRSVYCLTLTSPAEVGAIAINSLIKGLRGANLQYLDKMWSGSGATTSGRCIRIDVDFGRIESVRGTLERFVALVRSMT